MQSAGVAVNTKRNRFSGNSVAIAGIALTLLAGQFINRMIAERFQYDIDPLRSPIIEFVIINIVLSLIFLSLIWLIPRLSSGPVFFVALLVCGLLMRLILFGSNPVLEVDFYRYLWDGAVSANGVNPYLYSPAEAPGTGLKLLAQQSGDVYARINYAQLRTIYPPLTQFFFMLANLIDDWSLNAWRLLLLLAEVSGLALILSILATMGRSFYWSIIYWFNPLIIHQTYNGLHMDILLLPFLATAILCLLNFRYLNASLMLTLAAGIKLWPLILLPFTLRPLMAQPKLLIAGMGIIGFAALVVIAPLLYYGLGAQSGLDAYAQGWQRNSAVFPLLNSFFGLFINNSEVGTRLTITMIIIALSLYLNRRPLLKADLIITSFIWVIASLFILSPTQFPWYCLWFLPLLSLYPNPALLLFSATMPIYYLKFYFVLHEQNEIFDQYIVALQYLPVLIALIATQVINRKVLAASKHV